MLHFIVKCIGYWGESMNLSRMSLTNWLEKGSTHFCELITYLKNTCLEEEAIVNCDETWCWVKL